MRKKVLLLINTASGATVGKDRLSTIVTELVRNNCEVVVYPINPGEGFGSETIIEETDYAYDCVICSGGDGTLNHLVNSLYDNGIDTVIGYLPAGSTNDFASSLFGSRNLDVGRYCRGVGEGLEVRYDIGKFNDRYFNYIAAFGAFVNISYDTNQQFKNAFGYLAYMMNAIGNLPEALNSKIKAKIRVNDQETEGEFLIGTVSNTTSIAGMESPIINRSELNDGIFELSLIRAPKNVHEWNEAIALLLAGTTDNQRIISLSGNHFEIEFEKETAWTLDGEDGGKHKKVVIDVLKEKQRIFLPSPLEK